MARPRKEAHEPNMARIRDLVDKMYCEILQPRPESDYSGLSYAEKCGYIESVLEELVIEVGFDPQEAQL